MKVGNQIGTKTYSRIDTQVTGCPENFKKTPALTSISQIFIYAIGIFIFNFIITEPLPILKDHKAIALLFAHNLLPCILDIVQ